jgi:hypothetical protein
MDGDGNKLKNLHPTLSTVAIDISLSLSAQPGGMFLALPLVGVGIHPICVDGGHRQTSSVGAQHQSTMLAPMPITTVSIHPCYIDDRPWLLAYPLATLTVDIGLSSLYANCGSEYLLLC